MLLKRFLFGNGLHQEKILFGKAKGIRLYADPDYSTQELMGAYEREIQASFTEQAKGSDSFFGISAADGYSSLLYKKYAPTAWRPCYAENPGETSHT